MKEPIKFILIKILLIILFSSSGCFLIPLTEPDSKALGDVDKECRIFSCKKSHRISKNSASRTSIGNDERRINRLISNLDSKSDVVRTHASTDLGNLGMKASSATSKLEDLAKNDESKWVRRSAVKALSKIGSKSSLPVLEHVKSRDKNSYVRESASNAIAKIKATSRSMLK